MKAAARARAATPETPQPAPAAPVRPAAAQSTRRPSASGPPALRLAEPPPAPVAAPAPVQPERPPEPQREEGFFDSVFWRLVRQFAPDLEAFIRGGIFGWLEKQITAAIARMVDSLFAPIRAVTGVAATLTTLFQSLIDWMQEAAAKIAKGDCSSITEAAEKIEQVVTGVLEVVSDKIKALAKKVSDFFGGLWNRFGAPVWEMLKEIGGEVWDRIQAFGQKLWDSTERIRRESLAAWKWIKDRLGIGEGPEGQNGLLQWVKAKAEEVWNWLKPRIEPYKKQLAVIAGIVLLLSPAGPILIAGAAVVGLMYGIRWIRRYLRSRADLIAQRGVLEGAIIPALLEGIELITGGLKSAANRVSTRLGDVVGALGQFASGLATSLLDAAKQLIEWIREQFEALSKWASEKLNKLVEWVNDGMARLRAWAQPALEALHRVSDVVTDIVKIPVLVVSKAWHKIPACLRDPFVGFLVNQVLKRIPLFKTVTEVLPAVWQKIKTTALSLLRKVFLQGKLKEAAIDVLKLVLEALDVPLELIKTVFTKGLDSIDLILDKPFEFLSNMLGAVRQGIFQFGDRIVFHLLNGLQNWIFAAATKAGLTPPAELSFKAVFEFVLQVLDVTVDRVLERLEKRIGPEKTKVIRKVLTVMSKVWEWISTLLNEGPAGVWKKLLGQLGDLWGSLLTTAVDYITKTVTKIALQRVLALVTGGPIGVVINAIIAIWKALQTFAKYLRKILDIINVVFDTIADIARGAIAGAANMVENLMDRSLPVILAFLANQIGLGDLSERIKVVLEAIRAKVAEAIDWLIDKALAIGGAILGLVKAGVGKVLEWWKDPKKFTLGGKEHTLKFQGEGPDAQLMVESTPMVLEQFLDSLPKPKSGTKADKALAIIKGKKKEIDELKDKIRAGDKSYGQTAGTKIKEALEIIAAQLEHLGKKLPPTFLKTRRTHKAMKDDVGAEIHAMPLTLNPGGLSGSEPHETTDLWDKVKQRKSTYVRGHLLNHHVHGPGENFNMAPIPIAANNEMERNFETYVKHAVLGGGKLEDNYPTVVDYHVTMEFHGHKPRKVIPEESLLPTRIVLEASEVKEVDGTWTPVKPLFSGFEIPIKLGDDLPAGVKQADVNLSEDDVNELAKIEYLEPALPQAIRDAREARGKPFHEYDDLDEVKGMTAAVKKKLKEDDHVLLRSGYS
jgi:hypothetical protein